MVPEGWKLVTIGNLTSSHSYGPRFSSKDYDVNGTVKTIRNTDVTETGEILYKQVPSAHLDSEIIEQHKLKTGDLIIITTADCGLSAIFEEQDIAYIPSAYAVRYRLNQTVLPTFIKYFMHTSIAQKQVGQFIRKGTVANLPGSDVLKIKVALPPLPEQKKIAAILSSVDEAIASTQTVIDQTRKVKQGLLQQLLTRGIGHTKFKESAIGEIPAHWKVKKVGDIGRVIRGASPRPKGDPKYYGGNVPRLMVADVTRDGKYVTPSIDFLTEEGAKLSRLMPAGSLTIVCSGTVGVPSILSINACIHDGFLALDEILEDCNVEYLYYFFSTRQREFDSSATHGGVFTNLTTSIFKDFKLPIPPLEEQEKIVEILASIDNQITQVKIEKDTLEKIKSGLMQDLLTGKVRVGCTS